VEFVAVTFPKETAERRRIVGSLVMAGKVPGVHVVIGQYLEKVERVCDKDDGELT
jgi:hypothetical protein